MSYVRAMLWGATAGCFALAALSTITIELAAAQPWLETVASIMLQLPITFIWVAVGAFPSAALFIEVMRLLERRFPWSGSLPAWILLAVATGLPGSIVLTALLNLGDPAEGTEKHLVWDALWAGLATAAIGGGVAWWCRHKLSPCPDAG